MKKAVVESGHPSPGVTWRPSSGCHQMNFSVHWDSESWSQGYGKQIRVLKTATQRRPIILITSKQNQNCKTVQIKYQNKGLVTEVESVPMMLSWPPKAAGVGKGKCPGERTGPFSVGRFTGWRKQIQRDFPSTGVRTGWSSSRNNSFRKDTQVRQQWARLGSQKWWVYMKFLPTLLKRLYFPKWQST